MENVRDIRVKIVDVRDVRFTHKDQNAIGKSAGVENELNITSIGVV